MGYTVTLYRCKVKDMEASSTDDEFFDHEETFPAFTAQQQHQLHERLSVYGYVATDRTNTHTVYLHEEGIIEATLFTTSLVFSVTDSDLDAVFEVLQTASEFTDNNEFAVYNWQQGAWNEGE